MDFRAVARESLVPEERVWSAGRSDRAARNPDHRPRFGFGKQSFLRHSHGKLENEFATSADAFDCFQINNLEKQKVGCRLHHWSTVPAERLLHEHEFWKKPIELMFPETDAEAMEAHVKIMNRLQEEFLDRQRETILRQNEVMKRRSDRRARRALAKKKKRH